MRHVTSNKGLCIIWYAIMDFGQVAETPQRQELKAIGDLTILRKPKKSVFALIGKSEVLTHPSVQIFVLAPFVRIEVLDRIVMEIPTWQLVCGSVTETSRKLSDVLYHDATVCSIEF